MTDSAFAVQTSLVVWYSYDKPTIWYLDSESSLRDQLASLQTFSKVQFAKLLVWERIPSACCDWLTSQSNTGFITNTTVEAFRGITPPWGPFMCNQSLVHNCLTPSKRGLQWLGITTTHIAVTQHDSGRCQWWLLLIYVTVHRYQCLNTQGLHFTVSHFWLSRDYHLHFGTAIQNTLLTKPYHSTDHLDQ